MNEIRQPHVTVAAVVENEGRFLLVEERINGRHVINQPAGHLEAGETLIDACARETLEETGWLVEPVAVVGIYQYHSHPENVSFVRFTFAARAVRHDAGRVLDDEIIAARWMSDAELDAASAMHRSPLVAASVRDFRRGDLLPLTCLHSY